jgi:hypothetical protein
MAANGGNRLDTLGTVLKVLGIAVGLGASILVVLELLGVVSVFGAEGDSTSERLGDRLPGEYLYLDDERVDAYLGQLEGGIAPSEARSMTKARERRLDAGLSEVAQVGSTVREEETVAREVSLKAADRYYKLESDFDERFGAETNDGRDVDFHQLRASKKGCDSLERIRKLPEGEIVRITGAKLQAPTYALALAKVAHAPQYVAPFQDAHHFRLAREDLSRLARNHQRSLRAYVRRFGGDPRLLLRMTIPPRHGTRVCTVLLPVRYSKLADSPSLLSGAVTVVGKVVRHLTRKTTEYYDVETAVTYGNAVRAASKPIKDTLGLEGPLGTNAVGASAIARYPGLVVLPIAMYK